METTPYSKLYSKYAKFMGMGEYYCGGAGKTCEAISGNSLDYYFNQLAQF